ncbi:MAG: hydrolase [Prolixibacteraceae bacterium]|nr:hydrolase [Prolixibacteraceae bacterium]
MRILQEESIALFIDFQERLVPAMRKNKELIENTEKLHKGLKELAVPMIFTQQYTRGLGPTVNELVVNPDEFSYVEKTSFSCCDEEKFIQTLEGLNKKNVIICGIESHVCVLQTAIDLKNKGYNPVLVVDCISSRKKESIKVALKRMEQEGVLITNSESILFELTRDAKNPAFKAISSIVK